MQHKLHTALASGGAGILIVLAILALWEAASRFGAFDSFLFPEPLKVLQSLLAVVFGGAILPDLASTLLKIAIALVVGSLTGVGIGVLLSKWAPLYNSTTPLLDFCRSIPATALFPLFLLIFGAGDPTNIALATWICALYLSLYVSKGLRSTSETALTIAKILKKSEIEILTKIRFMEALPMIFVGFRTAMSLTVVVIIVTEMFVGTTKGLGKALIDSAYVYDIPRLYAVIIIVGLIGYLLNQLVIRAEQRVVHWENV